MFSFIRRPWKNRALRAEWELDRLRKYVLAAHPSGTDPDPDPVKVVETLGREWIEMVMSGPEAKVTVFDGGFPRVFEWIDTDEDGAGYVPADEDAPTYFDLVGALGRLEFPRPFDDWHEDTGPALWWRFPIAEAPWCGSPLDSDWPGYHTHWTPLPDAGAIQQNHDKEIKS